jgi:hypothetical protein
VVALAALLLGGCAASPEAERRCSGVIDEGPVLPASDDCAGHADVLAWVVDPTSGAKEDLKAWSAADPAAHLPHWGLALCAFLGDERLHEIAELRRCVEKAPACAPGWERLGDGLLARKWLESARQAYAIALQLDPADVQLATQLVRREGDRDVQLRDGRIFTIEGTRHDRGDTLDPLSRR